MRKLSDRHGLGRKFLCLAGVLVLTFLMAFAAAASDDDNSLQSLGITTEGVTVEPEFSYSTWEYTVTVPAGTKELQLDPVPSSDSGKIADVSGTTLNEDGTGTVEITVEAGNGAQFTYVLNVVSNGEPVAEEVTEAQTETEKQTETERQTEKEKETEPQTESPVVEVDRNTVQEAQNTISALKQEILNYRDTIRLYTYIIYGLIALSVVLLFLVINLLLRKNDLKRELKEYRSLGYEPAPKKSRKTSANDQFETEPRKQPRKQKRMPAYEEEAPQRNEKAVRQAPARNGQKAPARNNQQAARNSQQAPARNNQQAPARNNARPANAPSGRQAEGSANAPAQTKGSQNTAPAPAPQNRESSQARPEGNAPANSGQTQSKPNDVQINMIDL